MMKKLFATAILGSALGLFSSASHAQVPSAGEGTPTGMCQAWNGKEYESRPCVDESGGRRKREPRGRSAEEQAHDLDRIGARLYNQGNLEEALEQFQSATRIDPRDGSAYYGICLINAKWNNFAHAYTNCDLALKLGTPVWSTSKSELRQYTNSLLDRLADQNANFQQQSDERSFEKGKDFYDARDWDRALYFLDFYTDPRWNYTNHKQEALAMKGTVLTRMGRFTDAEQALYQSYLVNPQKALDDVRQEKHPNLADALWDLTFMRGHAVQGEDIDSSLLRLSLFQQSLRFSPKNPRSLYWLAKEEGGTFNFASSSAHFYGALYSLQEKGQQVFFGYSPLEESKVNEMIGLAQQGVSQAHAHNFRAFDLERSGEGTDEASDPLDRPSYLKGIYTLFLGDPEKAYPLFKGLLSKYPDNKDYKHYCEILSRIVVHQPFYINEAKRQAEAAEKNGHDGVLYEIDQNMKCVAGQTFDGAGTCINNGFSWP